ncbi:MAG TPA: murein L,D-transpeptidase catalytic domain family protein [Puia sp.]|nr:murein L,D-transpeptidase catalytic domain family protein [Puia sp.]
MKTLSKLVSTSSVSLLVITSPVLISGSHKKINEIPVANSTVVSAVNYMSPVAKNSTTSNKTITYAAVTTTVSTNNANYAVDAAAKKAFEVKMVIREASGIYDSMRLGRTGLNQKAFEYAWRGYHNLLKKGIVQKSNVLSICDFTQSSRRKRLYVIDVTHRKLLYNTYVAHGMNSGVEYATSFSNQPESFKSSLGFYLTSRSYKGRNGLSLKIIGLEKGYNDLAAKRNIVLHGADYIGNEYLNNNGEMGRSLGCAAIPTQVNPKIIKSIKNGSALFMYYPAKKYLSSSAVING